MTRADSVDKTPINVKFYEAMLVYLVYVKLMLIRQDNISMYEEKYKNISLKMFS